jgi:hypothetical protein
MLGKFVEVLKVVEPVLSSEKYCYNIKKVSLTDAGVIEISVSDDYVHSAVNILIALKELLPDYSFSRSVSASAFLINIDLLSTRITNAQK